MTRRCSGEKGFSLIELMVAMLITVIISGAIFGLMTASQTAFKREPARSDAQQNLRAAMDGLQRDIAAAGGQISPWVQAFTTGDSALEAPPLLDRVSPLPDSLQIFGADGACPALAVDAGAAGAGGTVCGAAVCPAGPLSRYVHVAQMFPGCFGPPTAPMLVGLSAADGSSFFVGTALPIVPGPTPPFLDPVSLDFATAQGRVQRCGGILPVPATCPGGPPLNTMSVAAVQVVRYEVLADPPPLGDGVPGLWRSATGGVNLATGGFVPAPGVLGNWQMVARGVENMQVTYTPACGGAPVTSPPVVVPGTWATLVTQVSVTLTGRTIMEGPDRLAGAQDIRTQLTGTATPRAALAALTAAPAGCTWN